jgi:hypothetical protein
MEACNRACDEELLPLGRPADDILTPAKDA